MQNNEISNATIKPKASIRKFEGSEEKTDFLVKHGFTKSAAMGLNPIYYSGFITNGEKTICHIIGYIDEQLLVIDFGLGEHTIHADYLAEMNASSVVVIEDSKKYKGKKTDKAVVDYVVFDLETTGLSISTDDIIEIGAIRVRDNAVVDTFETFIKPDLPFREPQVSHITNDMVKDAPSTDEAISNFLDFLGDDVAMGYNNATFDLPFLAFNSPESISNKYVDVLILARKYLFGPENHKLETLKEYYNLHYKSHRALEDCMTTKSIYDLCVERKMNKSLLEKEQVECRDKPRVYVERKINSNYVKPNYSTTTKGLQDFKHTLELITADNEISEEEVEMLQGWMNYHNELKGNYPFDKIYSKIETILDDGVITAVEKVELLKQVEDYLKPANDDGVTVVFENKKFIKTGEFAFGSEQDIKEYIESKGGIFIDRFTKDIDYVVIGDYGSPAWKQGSFGGKVEKAKKYNDSPKADHHIFIIKEKQLFGGGNDE